MKRALIVGATGGIGSALARRLAGRWELTLSGRNAQRLRSLREATGADVVITDLESELEVQALLDPLADLELVIYAAGAVAPAPLAEMRAADWQRVVDANLTGLFHVLKHASTRLAEGAKVVILGARPALVSAQGFGAYAASKAAVAALAEVAGIELRRRASVTLVLPVAVDTPLWDAVGRAPRHALQPDEVAEAVVAALDGVMPARLEVG